jgi:hypothetical protein
MGDRLGVVEVGERVEFARPIGSDDLERNAQRLRDPLAVVKFVDAILRSSDPQTPALMEVDRLSSLGFDRVVELEAVLEDLHQVPARDHLRAQARCVPRRAAREFACLDEGDVVPTELRQVVEDAAAGDAAADDDDFRFTSHFGDLA